MRNSSNWSIRVVALTSTRNILGGSTRTTRWSYNFRIAIDYVARNCFLNRTSTTPGISEVPAGQTGNATPWSIITSIVPSTRPAISRTIVAVITAVMAIVTIVTRMRISLVIRQRVPANVITEVNVENERDQCRTPPTPLPVKLAAWTPGPKTVVINPTTIVIGRPTPRFISHPRPAIRRTP